MIDPVKKLEQQKVLIEEIFGNLFSKTKTPPSMKQIEAVKAYQEKYQILFKIKNNPINKVYNSSQLIDAYQNDLIDNNTEIKQFGTKKPYQKFEEFLKFEPFKSELRHNTFPEPPKLESKIWWKNDFTGTKQKQGTLKEIGKFLYNNKGQDDNVDWYDGKDWISIKSSKFYPKLQKWVNYFAAGGS